jgi:hypothetical protein
VKDDIRVGGGAYSSVFGSFRMAPLQGDSVAFALKALRGDKALDLWGFGIWFLAFALRLDFATDDEFADLSRGNRVNKISRTGHYEVWDRMGVRESLHRRPCLNQKIS